MTISPWLLRQLRQRGLTPRRGKQRRLGRGLAPNHRNQRPILEELEPRNLPSTTPFLVNSGLSDPNYLTPINGTLFFQATGVNGTQVWETDGTSTDTKELTTSLVGSTPIRQGMTNVNGVLYFRANDGSHGYELWKSDTSGTSMFYDINHGSNGSNLVDLTNVKGMLFFTANDGKSDGFQLWQSDGTLKDTYPVTTPNDVVPANFNPKNLANVNGTLFFSGKDENGSYHLWQSNGVDPIHPSQSVISSGDFVSPVNSMMNVNDPVFFIANDGSHGYEIWKTDSTSANGVSMVTDYPSFNPENLTNFNGILFFSANDPANGTNKLWENTSGSKDNSSVGCDLSSARESRLFCLLPEPCRA
jgi:ELWxxDGT repeat protein